MKKHSSKKAGNKPVFNLNQGTSTNDSTSKALGLTKRSSVAPTNSDWFNNRVPQTIFQKGKDQYEGTSLISNTKPSK